MRIFVMRLNSWSLLRAGECTQGSDMLQILPGLGSLSVDAEKKSLLDHDGLLDRCLKLMADAHGSDDGLIWEVYQDVLKKLRCVEYRLRSRTVCLTASDAVTTA